MEWSRPYQRRNVAYEDTRKWNFKCELRYELAIYPHCVRRCLLSEVLVYYYRHDILGLVCTVVFNGLVVITVTNIVRVRVTLQLTVSQSVSQSVCCLYLWGKDERYPHYTVTSPRNLVSCATISHHFFCLVFSVLPSLHTIVGLRCNLSCSGSFHNSHVHWCAPQRPSLTTRPVHLNTVTRSPRPSSKLRNICRRYPVVMKVIRLLLRNVYHHLLGLAVTR
jgi:hypothetical protein